MYRLLSNAIDPSCELSNRVRWYLPWFFGETLQNIRRWRLRKKFFGTTRVLFCLLIKKVQIDPKRDYISITQPWPNYFNGSPCFIIMETVSDNVYRTKFYSKADCAINQSFHTPQKWDNGTTLIQDVRSQTGSPHSYQIPESIYILVSIYIDSRSRTLSNSQGAIGFFVLPLIETIFNEEITPHHTTTHGKNKYPQISSFYAGSNVLFA